MKIKRYSEIFNYKYIINTLCNEYGFGNAISNEIDNFEKSTYYNNISNDNDYILQFNTYLINKDIPKNTVKNISIKSPTNWYAKST